MAVATTGSAVFGTVQGLALGLDNKFGEVTSVNGNPDGVVTAAVGSQVAFDRTNAVYYISQTGSKWAALRTV